MRLTISEGQTIRIVSGGHAAYAAATIGLGIMGLVTGDFAQIWQPVPKWLPAHVPLAYLVALLSVGCGIGVLVRRSASVAARALFFALLTWVLVLRVPPFVYQSPRLLVAWSFGATAVMAAGAWVLAIWFAPNVNPSALRAARVLYGVSLIPFGLAHFVYLDATTVLIPSWLPWHVAFAYGTGTAFVAAGLAVAFDVLAPLAATLSALQFGLFGLIVWVPRVVTGNVTPFQRGEFITTCALTAGGWVVTDSYRRLRERVVVSSAPTANDVT